MLSLWISATCRRTVVNMYRTKFMPDGSLGLGSKPPTHINSIRHMPSLRHTSTSNRPLDLRMKHNRRIFNPMSCFILLMPITTFCLGTWQVKRRKWKENLIAELKSRSSAPPRDLPYDLYELESLEYYPIQVKGQFDHSKEMYLGPRSLIVDGEGAYQSTFMSQTQSSQSGFVVVTPFHVEDRNIVILVNRGWVPAKYKNPETSKAGQIQGVTELVGVVRLNEQRAPFMPKNQTNEWFYRDLPKMAESVGAEPVFLDALASTTVPGGPVGGQTRISLRNEHLSYIFTWYGLSAITAFMWYRQFVHKVRVL